MRFVTYESEGHRGLAASNGTNGYRGLTMDQSGYPGPLEALIAAGAASVRAAGTSLYKDGKSVDLDAVRVLQPFAAQGKIICVGLNYADHASESSMELPKYPVLFARFLSSLIAHGEPIVRPRVSDKLDYEAELVAVIGTAGRRIPKARALDHVAGYSIFNDGSVRDYQTRTTQWTVGKNFDGTGSFGPVFVTSDDLPLGARGLRIETRLNGRVMQSASTDDLIFDVATLVTLISETLTLSPGDIIVTGTPSGVGMARKPPTFMKNGDICEVEVERIGILRNPVVDEADVETANAA